MTFTGKLIQESISSTHLCGIDVNGELWAIGRLTDRTPCEENFVSIDIFSSHGFTVSYNFFRL